MSIASANSTQDRASCGLASVKPPTEEPDIACNRNQVASRQLVQLVSSNSPLGMLHTERFKDSLGQNLSESTAMTGCAKPSRSSLVQSLLPDDLQHSSQHIKGKSIPVGVPDRWQKSNAEPSSSAKLCAAEIWSEAPGMI